MTSKRFLAIVASLAFSFSGVTAAAAAEKEELNLVDLGAAVILPMAPISTYAPKVERPAILPALYATLGAMQAWDIYSTRSAIRAGAREANPIAAPFTGNTGSMFAMKLAATGTIIVMSERLWRKNRVAAIVTLVALNGATAAVSMRNMRIGKALSTR